MNNKYIQFPFPDMLVLYPHSVTNTGHQSPRGCEVLACRLVRTG